MNKGIQKVLAIESRGFFFGVGIAERLNVGFIPVRKSGKLPWKTVSESYALEYGEASLEIHQDAIKPGESVLIVDDVLATGGTLRASHRLVEKLGGKVAGVACLLEIGFLNGRSLLHPLNPTVLWTM
jgi:adenine phosphoribosyltransferase